MDEPAGKVRFFNRLQARLSRFAPAASGFVAQPEPRSIGSFARGRQLVAGRFLFAGFLIEGAERSLWDLPMPDPAFEAELHDFLWLDDLAALGDAAARSRAQVWTFDWIRRYGRGRGPGWQPDRTGRRLIRWVNHALLLLAGQERQSAALYFRAAGQQMRFLSRRWSAAAPGLPRIEALTGVICAGLALKGMERHVAPAVAALARECQRQIAADGSIPSRNPEELLEIFTLLSWAAQALGEAGRFASPEHLGAIERIAPVLRHLRHADGGLARFHGGGRGMEGRLDQALANSGIRAQHGHGPAMGFSRLAGGRTSVIVDTEEPPSGPGAGEGHASTLAFELTSGRRPLIVNCGSGAPFGPEWRRAGRATPSHSTLAINGYSSSRFGGKGESFADLAEVIHSRQSVGSEGTSLLVGHTGYSATHGLTHMRGLVLSQNGRSLTGEDTLASLSDAERERFDALLQQEGRDGVEFVLRFHLHPDVDAAIDLGGAAVSLALKSGELWVFRHDGHSTLDLQASVYLEKGRMKPRATKQIVLSATVRDYARQIRWTLSKAQVTPLAIRDLESVEAAPE